jgi:hypothetical protein
VIYTRHDADALSEPGCSRDQKQPCPDDDGPDSLRDAHRPVRDVRR